MLFFCVIFLTLAVKAILSARVFSETWCTKIAQSRTRGIFIWDSAYSIVTQWSIRSYFTKSQCNMPYPVWKCLMYGTAQSIYKSLCLFWLNVATHACILFSLHRNYIFLYKKKEEIRNAMWGKMLLWDYSPKLCSRSSCSRSSCSRSSCSKSMNNL